MSFDIHFAEQTILELLTLHTWKETIMNAIETITAELNETKASVDGLVLVVDELKAKFGTQAQALSDVQAQLAVAVEKLSGAVTDAEAAVAKAEFDGIQEKLAVVIADAAAIGNPPPSPARRVIRKIMSVDLRWGSLGGIFLDGTGDIAVTDPSTDESLVDMVVTRLKAKLDGWKLYRIGADLERRLGDLSTPETELLVKRQVIRALTSNFLPQGSFQVETLLVGAKLLVMVYVNSNLLVRVSLTQGSNGIEVTA